MTRRITRRLETRADWAGIVTRLAEKESGQRNLARRVGVHESTVSRWAEGIQRPTADRGLVLFLLDAGEDK